MTDAAPSTAEPSSLVNITKCIQTELKRLLQITNEDDTEVEKKSNDLITECTNCVANDQNIDIYTHCESIKRIIVILSGYKQIINCSETSEQTSICQILTFKNIYTLTQITNDFIHIKDHMDHNKTTAKELARKFREKLKNSISIYRRAAHTTFTNQDDKIFQHELQKMYSYLTHIELDNIPSIDYNYHVEHSGKFKQYVGKKEDDKWWEYNIGATDEDIYFRLIKKMGVFRWQSFHGFKSKQHQGLMHLRPKYNNIKEEALYNPYYPLSPDNWNQTLRKGKIFHDSFARKRIKTSYNGKYDDKITQESTNWTTGETINMSEIVIFKLYTDFDKLQYELKKCFRFETMCDVFTLNNFNPENNNKYIFHSNEKRIRYLLEQRLRIFYWWRIKLLTTLNKYAKTLDPKVSLYHGVNAKMILNNDRQTLGFCGPLSTSSSYHVARTFATAKGMVLEVNTQFPQLGHCRAFDVSLISDYPEEKEQLISFAYLRVNKVFTRPLNKHWKTFADIDDDKKAYNIPLSSITKAIFFAVHLFRQQIFSMSVHSEYWLTAFLYILCGYNENDDNEYGIKRTKFVDKLEGIMIENEYKECDELIDDVVRHKRILKILLKKFNNFRKFPNRSQVLKINVDRMSSNLKPYFMDYIGKDIYTKERYVISESKIKKIFPNIKQIKLEYDDHRKNSKLYLGVDRSVRLEDNVGLSNLINIDDQKNIEEKEKDSSTKITENIMKTQQHTTNDTISDDSIKISKQQLQSETATKVGISIQITPLLQQHSNQSISYEHKKTKLNIDLNKMKRVISGEINPKFQYPFILHF